MKKLFAMMLVFAILFLVTACSSHPALRKADTGQQGKGYITGIPLGMLPASGTENPVDIQALLQPGEKVTEYGQDGSVPVCIGDFLGEPWEWGPMERNGQIPDGQRILPAFFLPDKTGGKPIRFTALWTVAEAAGKKGKNPCGSRQGIFFRTGRAEPYQIRDFCRSRGP